MVSHGTRGSLKTFAQLVLKSENSRRTYVSWTSELFSRVELVEKSALYTNAVGTCAASATAPSQFPIQARTVARPPYAAFRMSVAPFATWAILIASVKNVSARWKYAESLSCGPLSNTAAHTVSPSRRFDN